MNSSVVALRELNINNVKVIGLIKDEKHKTDSLFINFIFIVSGLNFIFYNIFK